MRKRKSYKYKNYGSRPQNEYRTTQTEKNTGSNTGSDTPLECNAQAGDTAYRHRLIKRQAQHPSGRRKSRGGSRSWKVNGWRAESAAQHDESSGIGRYAAYV